MSRFKTIFTDDWRSILDVYHHFICPPSSVPMNERLPLVLLEIGVRFGERLSQYQTKGYVEIGCGLAIPSLTMATLGCPDGLAIDIDPKVVSQAEALREEVGCDFEIRCADVFENRPQLQKGQMLIAEKPASYKKNALEVEFTLSNWCKIEGHNFGIIPTILGTDTVDTYNERCAKYERRLRQVGFKVENKQAVDELPVRWIIAVK